MYSYGNQWQFLIEAWISHDTVDTAIVDANELFKSHLPDLHLTEYGKYSFQTELLTNYFH